MAPNNMIPSLNFTDPDDIKGFLDILGSHIRQCQSDLLSFLKLNRYYQDSHANPPTIGTYTLLESYETYLFIRTHFFNSWLIQIRRLFDRYPNTIYKQSISLYQLLKSLSHVAKADSSSPDKITEWLQTTYDQLSQIGFVSVPGWDNNIDPKDRPSVSQFLHERKKNIASKMALESICTRFAIDPGTISNSDDLPEKIKNAILTDSSKLEASDSKNKSTINTLLDKINKTVAHTDKNTMFQPDKSDLSIQLTEVIDALEFAQQIYNRYSLLLVQDRSVPPIDDFKEKVQKFLLPS